MALLERILSINLYSHVAPSVYNAYVCNKQRNRKIEGRYSKLCSVIDVSTLKFSVS
ncbi:hypothetical protein CRENPOLYSF1_240014 [Crenothrix polyspora]|uniref:Uncharacterized protein n=1 Tax=Crenothrix polyspora TaxID=360316 RepID=A0A1R4H6Z7_9GAMM|nr:hypothetical protein CRENPOLYSF1_240014 [Crenothrix polyspora]